MKATKWIMLPTLLVLFGFASCDDDDLKVDSEYSNALAKKYPDATRIEWERKKDYFVADCWVDAKDLEVWFSVGGVWEMTETELRTADLPEAISQAINESEYASWRIDDMDLLEYPSKAKEYVIEVEQGEKEIDLYYSESGELLDEKDVSNADDTHWPE